MQLKQFLKSGGMTALAAVIAMSALPGDAFAQSDNQRGWGGNANRAERAPRSNDGAVNRAPQMDRGSAPRNRDFQQRNVTAPQPTPQRQVTQPRPPQHAQDWSNPRMNDGSAPSSNNRVDRVRPGNNWQQPNTPNRVTDPNRNWNRDRNNGQQPNTPNQVTDPNRNWNRDRNNQINRDNNWNRDRNNGGFTRDRNGNWSRDGNRNGRPDIYRDRYTNGRGDWNRRWRDDNRYDWQRYRSNHRDTYRMGRYYAPYNSWSYRRLSIGFFLDSMFYSNRYWINDPWAYRLPPADGPYRWVRYYDDILLVNIYSGEVVDVINDFFW